MAEKVQKLILETEFKTTGTVEGSVSRVEQLQAAVKGATAGTLQLVEAEKKLEKASVQAGVSVSTETKKVNDLNKSFVKTSEQMQKIGQVNALKGVSQTLESATARVKQFTTELLKTGGAGAAFEKVTQEMEQFVNSLPKDVRNTVLGQLEADARKLSTAIERPVSRLRELKRLINTETDPVVLRKLQIEAGKLQDQLGDTNELIRALSSDTFFTDSLVEGIQTATGAFATFQGVAGLLADDQQAFAEASAKAQSALALLQGVQQLSNALKKEDNILTRAQIISQKAYTLVVGESTGAMKGFKLALAATGIGLLIIAIGLLVANFEEVKSVLGFGVNPELKENAKLSRDAAKAANEATEAYKAQEAFLESVGVTKQQRAQKTIELTEAEIKALDDLSKKEQQVLDDMKAKRSGTVIGGFKLGGFDQAELDEQQKKVDDLVLQQKNLAKASNDATKLLIDDEKERTQSIQEELKKQSDSRLAELNERERHTIAVLGIERAGEEAILKERISFQQKRVALLQQQQAEDPEFDKKSLTNAKNVLNELKRELDAIPTGTIPTLNRQIAELRDQLFGGDLVRGTPPFIQAAEDLAKLEEELKQVTDSINVQDVEVFAQGSLNQLNKSVNDLKTILDGLNASSKEAEIINRLLKQAQKELDDAEELLNPSAKKNNLLEILSEQERHELAMLSLKTNSERQQLEVQLQYAKLKRDAILADDKATEAQKLQANNIVVELQEQLNARLTESDRKLFDQRISNTQRLIADATNLVNTLINLELRKNDALISAQRERVSAAEKIADRGNAQILELEQKRLDALTKQREKFVRDQQKLAAAQIIIESMLAIAKAAGQPGGAFTIATTLIALAAGLAAARATATAASSQSFKKGGLSQGGYTGDGPPSGQSLKLGAKNYVYHNQEHITPHEVLAIGNNRDWLEKIRLNRLNIGEMMASKEKKVVVENNITQAGAHQEPTVINMNLNSKGIISIVTRDLANKVKLRTRK